MTKFNTIEEAIKDFSEGKILIVVDNEDRENEGDFICAAETISPEIVNFMALQGRGLLCTPLEETRADVLNLPLMVRNNTSLHETAFTVSVDLIGNGCTTGISTYDRCLTIKALANNAFTKDHFARPGHIFPLRAKAGGVLQRAGHTEAVIDLAKLAGMSPAGALIEILNDDGSMARLPQLFEKARQFGLKIISIHDLIEYRLQSERLIKAEKNVKITVEGLTYSLIQYRQTNTDDLHFAFVRGDLHPTKMCHVRVQHADPIVEFFDLFINDEKSLVKRAFRTLKEFPSVVLLLITNQNRSCDPLLRLHEHPHVSTEGMLVEQQQREIGIGAQILKDLQVGKMTVLSNNPKKTISLDAFGLEIVQYISF